MTEREISYTKWCIENDIHKFYIWQRWINVRREVLGMDKGECQACKKKKRYKKANTVHHNKHLKDFPELALDIWFEWRGEKKRNLVSLCRECHEEIHGYRRRKKEEPLTEERW